MAKSIGAIVVDMERCKGCQVCMVNCPTSTIGMDKKVNGKGIILPIWKIRIIAPDAQIVQSFVPMG